MSSILICTGFHRSGTSATALQLAESGLNMGGRIMGGNISNPLGHGEDWGVVELHDKILNINQLNWQYTGQKKIKVDDLFAFQKYVELREKALLYSKSVSCDLERDLSSVPSWGFKDPRACLFLNEWKKVLGNQANFLFVLRHWAASIESLLNRASRQLAYSLPALSHENANLKFWQKPDLAARMWIAYCSRLLHFVLQNRTQSFVITQRSLCDGFGLIPELNSRFGLNLNENAKSIINPNLLTEHASSQLVKNISEQTKNKLDAIWHQLLLIADFKSKNEEVDSYNPMKLSSVFVSEYEKAQSYQNERWVEALKPKVIEEKELTEEICFVQWSKEINNQKEESSVLELIRRSESVFLNQGSESVVLVAEQIAKRFSLSGEIMVSLGNWLQKHKLYEDALLKYRESLFLGHIFPHIYLKVGQCYQALRDFKRAKHYYDCAIKKNDSNPHFYVALGKLKRELGDLEGALENFQKAYQLSPLQASVVLPFCDLLLQVKQTRKAMKLCCSLLIEQPENVGALNLKNRILLLTNLEKGKSDFFNNISVQLSGKDRYSWLSDIVYGIGCRNAEQDFLTRVEKHWKML